MQFRKDIQGLRSLAVGPIVLFHAGVAALSGGFVGVDIFFVISGFLITSLIARDLERDRFSTLVFYQRRIVRIFPALFLVLLSTLLAGCLLLLPVELTDLGHSSAAATLFISNIHFWLDTGYFGGFAATKPLLHTWSLGVEEQFYIFFPILLILIRKVAPSATRPILWILSALSLAMALYVGLILNQVDATFYLVPFRAWELFTGGLIALGAFPKVDAIKARQVLALCGLAALIASLVLIDETSPFPAPWALLPCLGSALLIAYAPGTWTDRLLAVAPLQWIGAISYSLYLWHWPIITFYRLSYGMTLDTRDTIVLVTASLIAATLSYHLIEQPVLRRYRGASPRPVVLVGIVGLLAMVGIALLVASNADHLRKLTPEQDKIQSYVQYKDWPERQYQFRDGVCFSFSEDANFDRKRCLATDPDKRNVVVMGDSHAAMYWRAIALKYPQINVMQATASGCRPVLDATGAERCVDLIDYVLGPLVKSGKIDGIVLAGRWREDETDKLIATVRRLHAAGIRVTVIGPVVEYENDFPYLLARALIQHKPDSVGHFRRTARKALDDELGPQVEQAGGHYYSVYREECRKDTCRARADNGDPIHFDYGHVTLAGAKLLLKHLGEI